MKRAAEEKSVGLSQELERMRAQFSELQAFADVVSARVAKGISEGLKHGVEHGYAQRTVESLEAYDPELEGLKDAPMDVIMAALYLESDTGGMLHNLYATSAPAPLSSPSRYTQSRAEQKKRNRIVCRTHGVGSAHHARSDRVPVSAPIVVPQEMLHPELPGPGDRIVDFPEGKVDDCVFPTAVDWRTNAPKDGMPANGTYSVEAVRVLDTHRTPIQKQPKMLLCLVEMDLFSLIRAPNPTKVKTGSRPRAPHELPLLTLTAPRVIEMDDPAAATDSSGVPSTIERSPLDFAHEAEVSGRETAASEMPPPEDVPVTTAPGTDQAVETVAVEPSVVRESRKRGYEGIDANAPPKSLRRDHADLRPSGAPADVSDPDPLAFADAPSPHPADVVQSSQGVAVAGDPKSENVSSPAEVESPGSVYRPEWGVTNGSLLDTPEACQDLVDHAAPPGIQARESEIKNLEALLETEAGMKRAVKEKSVGLSQELERMRAQFSKLQVSHERLSQQVDALQQQVSGEETLKAAFKDYKRQQDQMVEQWCAEMDARLDALSVDFDEELYPHMLTAIVGRRWVIGHGLHLAMMKCAESLEMRQAFADVVLAGIAKGMSEGLKHGVEHRRSQLGLESIEAYDPEAEAKFVAALQSLKDLKFSLLDQLEGLKDAPMDVIMAALYLESDTGGMPHNTHAISAPVPHSYLSPCIRRSDGIPVSVPAVVPQGLAVLLVD
nr:hypothetical protein [Tanacetum cinerariifolium]